MRTTEEYTIMNSSGKIVFQEKGLTKCFHLLGANYFPSSDTIQLIKKKGYKKFRGHYIVVKGDEHIVVNLLERQKLEASRSSIETLKNNLFNINPILKLDGDLRLACIYTSNTLKEIADAHNISTGTVKSRMNKDKKIIKKFLNGGNNLARFTNGYRFLYLKDYIELIKNEKV